ncbi:MAG: ThuA domain-containing protein [Sphingomonadales bacterium]|nr:ThuA domain-containing protein [Sphingomonadales bacterium]
MKLTIKRVVLWILLLVAAFFAVSVARNWDLIQRLFLGGVKVYETQPPTLPAVIKRPAILVFSKTNAFRHEEAIPAANAMFANLAKANGWGYFQTENGATFSPEILARFDAVVFNNVSGDVFTPAQRQAFRTWLENGGGYVGIHAAGDNSHEAWGWYMNDLIGAVFTQHTMKPQFQKATVHVEDANHPATRGLPASWQRTEEWYSFDKSPRGKGYGVLVTVDEKTYNPEGMFGKDLHMGDHPVVWWHCAGKGRVLYSALGHRAEAYAEPEYRLLLANAVGWAAHQQGSECAAPPAAPAVEKAR